MSLNNPSDPEEYGWDQSTRAEAVLQHILESDVESAAAVNNKVPEEQRMTVEEAISARPVLDQDTGRNKARVLFVTTDKRALVKDSALRLYYASLAVAFDEVHVLCLTTGNGEDSFDRAGTNLWFYQIKSSAWWKLPWAARRAADEALTWNGLARPDVIVGVDLFEAGLAAYLISRKFSRQIQYHVYTDPFAPSFKTAATDNNWRVRIAKFILKRASSLRVSTGALKETLAARYRRLKDVGVLPRFYDFKGIADSMPSMNLHEKYRDFSFIILVFGRLTATGELHDVFAALHKLLKNPRIGLLVVGDGPGKQLFVEKVKILGIEKNVVFQKEADDLISYLKTADIMVELDTDEEAEVRILKGAMAGTPMLLSATDLRQDMFKDGESAFICVPDDLACVSQKVSKFINATVYRTKFSENAAFVAKSRINEDSTTHYQAIALSIESVLTTDR